MRSPCGDVWEDKTKKEPLGFLLLLLPHPKSWDNCASPTTAGTQISGPDFLWVNLGQDRNLVLVKRWEKTGGTNSDSCSGPLQTLVTGGLKSKKYLLMLRLPTTNWSSRPKKLTKYRSTEPHNENKLKFCIQEECTHSFLKDTLKLF